MIKEYQTDCESIDGLPLTWHGKRSVNLRYVTSVRPYHEGAVTVSLIGEQHGFVIREEYDRFVRDWQSVRQ